MSAIWNHWNHESGTGKGEKVRCKYCKVSVQTKNAPKCRRHTLNCKQVPNSIRKALTGSQKSLSLPRGFTASSISDALIQETPSITPSDERSMGDTGDDLELQVIEEQSPRPSSQSSMASAGDRLCRCRIKRERIWEYKELLAKAIISGNVAFNFTENRYLRGLFESFGLGIVLPTRKELSGSILSKLHMQCKQKIADMIEESSHVTVITDGWQNVRSMGVLNFILATPRPIFCKSMEIGGRRCTGKLVAGEIFRIIDTMDAKKISSVLTDNGRNMTAAQDVVTLKYPHIIRVNCAAHILNLLVNDLCKLESVNSFLKAAKEVVKEILGSKYKLGRYHEEWERFIADEKQKGRSSTKVSLCLPAETRWFGVRDMLNKLKRAKLVLQRLAIDTDVCISSSTKIYVLDEGFWEKLLKMENLLLPLIEGEK